MASLRQRNGHYEIVFSRTIDGKRVKKIFALGTKQERKARRLCDQYSDLEREGEIDPWNGWTPDDTPQQRRVEVSLTLRSVGDRFMESRSHVKAKTRQGYEDILRLLIEQIGQTMPVGRINEQDMRTFCFAPHLSTASQTSYLRFCRMFFRWMHQNGLVKEDVAGRVKYPRKTQTTSDKVISPGELKGLFVAYRQNRRVRIQAELQPLEHPWFRPLISLYFYQGLRAQEGINLTWEKVNLKREHLTISKTKNGKERTIPIRPDCLAILKAWHRLQGRPRKGLLFYRQVHGNPQPLLRDFVTKTFKRYAREAHLPERACLHGLRHSCGTELKRAGFDIRDLQLFMGHEHVTTTTIYDHLSASDLQAKLQKLGI